MRNAATFRCLLPFSIFPYPYSLATFLHNNNFKDYFLQIKFIFFLTTHLLLGLGGFRLVAFVLVAILFAHKAAVDGLLAIGSTGRCHLPQYFPHQTVVLRSTAPRRQGVRRLFRQRRRTRRREKFVIPANGR